MATMAQDEFLRCYKRELAYLRQMGAEFAEKYPQVARRLNLKFGQTDDPHVERLVESFAFLAGRIQFNLEQRFPEFTTAFLDLLYPHYLSPVPSMSICQCEVDPAQGKLAIGFTIPKGTQLVANAESGEICRFTSAYPVVLWPLEVLYAGLENADQFRNDYFRRFPAVLRVRLNCTSESIQQLDFDSLRFHLNGDRLVANSIYERLFHSDTRVAISVKSEESPILLPGDAIRRVGFGLEEEILPYPKQAHPGFRLLQEYFTFPEKFLFFDLKYLDHSARRSSTENAFDILFLLPRALDERVVIDRTMFALGCTPIVNLFSKSTEPVRLDHLSADYLLDPDLRNPKSTEIHSILKVSGSPLPSEEETMVFRPYYSFQHDPDAPDRVCYWHARRVPSRFSDVPGTDMRIAFLDRGFNPRIPATQAVYAQTLCTNRDLAVSVIAGTLLQIEEAMPLHRIVCLRQPTPEWQAPLGGETRWRLVSHLFLSSVSLCEGEQGLEALKEILCLYNFSEDASAFQQIQGLRGLTTRRVVRRSGAEAWRGFCKGIEITVGLDEEHYTNGSTVLFGAILQHFFALNISAHCFVQLALKSAKTGQMIKRWPPMVGEAIVL